MAVRVALWVLVLSVLMTISVLVSLPAERISLSSEIYMGSTLQELIAGSPSMSVLELSKHCDIESIQMERSMCYGTCPSYTTTLNRDGTAQYFGDAYVERLGAYEGTLAPRDFAHLCQLTRDISFDNLESEYRGGGWTDSSDVIVAVTRFGKATEVLDYSETGPSQLWALENSIDAVASRIEWKKVAEKER